MESTILFRDFEERDIDFVYNCKNDEKLNSMIVGQFKPFSHEDAKKWVYGCMGEHDNFKFWALCTNDEEKRIVGWVAISDIDKINKSAFFYSQVIGDSKYRNGLPWIEIQQYVLDFVFEKLCFDSFSYSCLTIHPTSMSMGPVLFFENPIVQKDAICKDGILYDLATFTLKRKTYVNHRNLGDYELTSLIERYATYRRKKK